MKKPSTVAKEHGYEYCDLCISLVLIPLWISGYNLWQAADYSVCAGH